MKRITLFGLEGTGFRNPIYAHESGLIRAGHVGFAFEGEEEQIYGFHPSLEAIQRAGGEALAIDSLLRGKSIDGVLHLDNAIFKRAFELAQLGARTIAWQLDVAVSGEDFQRNYNQTREWYTKQTSFPYAFPRRELPLTNEKDNCATFPRRLGLPLPEQTGQLSWYIEAIRLRGDLWKPK